MKLKRSHFLKLSLAAVPLPFLKSTMPLETATFATLADPLPAWQEGQAKTAIMDFVQQAVTEGSGGYIPPRDRIATFDNDGTLWCEQPLVQGMYVAAQVQAHVDANPELAAAPVVTAILNGDKNYFANPAAMGELVQVLKVVSANQSQVTFNQSAAAFLATATHPQYSVKYTELGYQPQLELLAYLRAHGFQTWICSGGGMDFIRLVSEEMYGIQPPQVIGSSLEKEYRGQPGQTEIWRLPEIDLINDKEGKPVGIDRAIGQPPVFACGNVRSGGDIAMLTYSQSSPHPSFQLLINHDDGDREFAYNELDNASLTAAQQNHWQVVSMQTDWNTIFAWQ